MPRFSFLIPAYNAEDTLAASLESCLLQTEPDFEVLVVDDGSTDRTAVVAAELARRDARVQLLTTAHHGVVHALVTGLAACRGEYVARLDADDIAASDRLETQRAVFEAEADIAVVDSQVEFFREDGDVPLGMRLYGEWVNAVLEPDDFDRALLAESPVVHPAASFRKQAVLDAGGYREGPFPEDYDLWLRLHARGHRFRKLPRVLVRMRDHDHRLTRTNDRYSRAGFRRVAQAWLRKRVLSEPRRVALWGAGRRARAWHDWLLEIESPPVAVIDVDPRKIGTQRHGAPVVSYETLAEIGADVCLVAVGRRGAVPRIREAIAGLRPDWVEGRSWWSVVC